MIPPINFIVSVIYVISICKRKRYINQNLDDNLNIILAFAGVWIYIINIIKIAYHKRQHRLYYFREKIHKLMKFLNGYR